MNHLQTKIRRRRPVSQSRILLPRHLPRDLLARCRQYSCLRGRRQPKKPVGCHPSRGGRFSNCTLFDSLGCWTPKHPARRNRNPLTWPRTCSRRDPEGPEGEGTYQLRDHMQLPRLALLIPGLLAMGEALEVLLVTAADQTGTAGHGGGLRGTKFFCLCRSGISCL